MPMTVRSFFGNNGWTTLIVSVICGTWWFVHERLNRRQQDRSLPLAERFASDPVRQRKQVLVATSSIVFIGGALTLNYTAPQPGRTDAEMVASRSAASAAYKRLLTDGCAATFQTQPCSTVADMDSDLYTFGVQELDRTYPNLEMTSDVDAAVKAMKSWRDHLGPMCPPRYVDPIAGTLFVPCGPPDPSNLHFRSELITADNAVRRDLGFPEAPTA